MMRMGQTLLEDSMLFPSNIAAPRWNSRVTSTAAGRRAYAEHRGIAKQSTVRMNQEGFSSQSGFLDVSMQATPPEEQAEIDQLRAEITKRRQREPKLTEILKVRSEALAQPERRIRQLQNEREGLLAASRRQAEALSTDFDEESMETRRLQLDRVRLEKDLNSLENRNRLLQQTVEILNGSLADAVAEIGMLRESQQVVAPTAPPAPAATEDGPHIMLRIKGIGEKALQMLQ
ncbi:MAG: hypothetical protein FJ194_01280 [Gammaproteobacteria bacterium]|nr:hypothetical protein [Gammaproteobacteria bacterium]